MSDNGEVTFEDIIWHLQNNEDPSVRAEAAQILGENVEHLNNEQYEIASKALNAALTDPHPQVIMDVMNALPRFNRPRTDITTAQAAETTGEAISMSVCGVCGKPEALVDGATCEFGNCPYR